MLPFCVVSYRFSFYYIVFIGGFSPLFFVSFFGCCSRAPVFIGGVLVDPGVLRKETLTWTFCRAGGVDCGGRGEEQRVSCTGSVPRAK